MTYPLKSALAISLVALTATAANAQDRPRVNLNQPQVQQNQVPGITYTYAGARYMMQDWNGCDQDGLNLYGSLDIQDGFFARASYTDVSGDPCGSSTFSAGGGYHTAYSDSVDMYATLSLQSLSIDAGGSDSGIELAAGMRTYLREQLEGSLELFHATVGDSQTGIRGGLLYWFDPQFAVTGDVGLDADTTTFAIGARMAF